MPAHSTVTADLDMAGLIAESIRRTPGQVAIGVADGSMPLTYRQLDQLARSLARQLSGAGITSADTVALYCDDRPEFVIAMLAAWQLGAAVAPINPQLAAAEVPARLTAAGASAVLLPVLLRRGYPAGALPAWAIKADAGGSAVTLTAVPSGSGTGAAKVPAQRGQDPGKASRTSAALLLATTGSTGEPKVVPLTHANLAASVRGIRSCYHLGPGDATLVVMPLFHSHGLVGGLLATLASSGAAYFPAAGRFSAHLFWNEITRTNATWYTAVPTIHQILLARAATEFPAGNRPALRFIRSCSAPLAPAVLHRTEELFGAPMIDAYGMTETTHQAASNSLPDDGGHKEGSVGLPSGLQIRIVTPDGTPAGTEEVGEVCVRGPAVADGYLNDPQATAMAFVNGWFHTGDLGHLDVDGYLFLKGRIKEIINRGGEKIAPQTVEAALLSNPDVQEAAAFAVPDPKYGEDVNAAVILQPDSDATEADLKRHCQAGLAAFEVPARIYFPDRFPRTAKGDPDRRALAAAFTGPQPAA
ncbi:MAG: sauT [Actinomycetia bacterium]|nr:sauT [Actinomycetes bacterium]